MDELKKSYLVAWPTEIEVHWLALLAGIVTGLKAKIKKIKDF
jgi:hypothetical protein